MKTIKLNKGLFAFVDDGDFERVSKLHWWVYQSDHRKYAIALRPQLQMHRLILSPPRGVYIDHIDGNGLNNQRANLRFANNSTNQMNARKRANTSSKFKGVSFQNGHKKPWRAYINKNGKRTNIGYFATEQLAAFAYNEMAAELFGEFARGNEVSI